MLLRFLLLATLGLSPLIRAAAPASPNAGTDLAPLFAAAQKDPAGVVPLILEASAELQALDPKEALLLGDTLDAFSRRAFFGPERLPGMERLGLVLHTVSKGENPTRIAQRYHIDPGLIAYLNKDYDERRLHAGDTLKVLDLSDGSLQIVVHKDRYRLCAWRNVPVGAGGSGGRKVLIAEIPVGLGAHQTPTPLGTTKITKRVLKPEWTNPVTKQTYPDGDPNNVLGGYWIALDSDGIGKNGIGLHGYTGSAPANWIEQPASSGCVRMLQPDIDRIYRLALEGTTVVIEP
jgi:hypothetical protein